MRYTSPPLPFSKMSHFSTFVLLLLFNVISLTAQQQTRIFSPFQKTSFSEDIEIVRSSPLPHRFSSYRLEVSDFAHRLSTAPLRFSATSSDITIRLPQYDGSIESFSVFRAPVFSKELTKKYEQLSSYHLQHRDNQEIAGRIDITEHGIYIFILNNKIGNTYIEPYTRTSDNSTSYITYTAADAGTEIQHQEFSCGAHHDLEEIDAQLLKGSINPSSDCQIRKYRLAVSATGEYTQWHGGTKADAMSKIMVLVSRTNLIFEREMSITFELVDNNDLLVFTEPLSDPFTNDNKFILMHENQSTTDNLIGSSAYDLGIVVGIVGGGVAQLNSLCNDISKGQSSAGSTWAPEGYPLESTFIHEIAHKFGASHSFNNFCNGNRVNATAFETGSGSSLMSYAGACAPSVTYPRDFYFHPANLQQMTNFLLVDLGGGCGELIGSNLQAAEAQAPEDRVLPAGVPFELTGEAVNANANVHLYSWEQVDNGIANAPPQPNSNLGPNFRSYPARTSPTRVFPSIDCILNNNNGQNCEWEVLPTKSREMNFRFTVCTQSNNTGCWSSDNLNLQFVKTEALFAINFPNGGEHLPHSEPTDIQWNTGETNLNPINSPTVDIFLSTDGGYTFDILLEENIANTGNATVDLPAVVSDKCRIKIKGHNHYFFDLSDENFSIGNTPNFVLNPVTSFQSYCGDLPESFSFEIEVTSEGGFDQTVSFPSSDNGGSNSLSIFPSTLTPPGIVTIEAPADWADTNPQFSVTAIGGSISKSIELNIEEVDSAPLSPLPLSPIMNAEEMNLSVNLDWTEVEDTDFYSLEISEQADFSDLLYNENTPHTNLQLSQLPVMQVLYWRVRAVNDCGASAWSMPFAFRTKNRVCTTYSSSNTPREISNSGYTDAFARIPVDDDFIISEARVKKLAAVHTHVGDLSGSLICPQGKVVQLFYRPGLSEDNPYGCNGDGLNLSFADDAEQSNEELRHTCNEVPQLAITGLFQAAESFNKFNGEPASGHWLLNINDLSESNGGLLTHAEIELCRDDIQPDNDLLIQSSTLTAVQSNSTTIDEDFLSTNEDEANFQLVTLPANGTLKLDDSPLTVGMHFTQSDIDNGDLTYTSENSAATQDGFYLDATSDGNQWSGLHLFSIDIVLSAPFPTASITEDVSCFDENDGVIEVDVIYGTAPYQYSLDGENFQEENIFTNLSSGQYQVFVSDAMGFVIESAPVYLVNPQPVEAEISVEGFEISIDAQGGNYNFEYSIDGENFQDDEVLTAPQDGVYTVTVTDGHGCSYSENVVVNNLVTNLNVTQYIACHNASNATIEVETQNGIPPFQYRLNGGDFQNEASFSNLPAGDYIAEIQDAIGTIFSTENITISNPLPITAEVINTGYSIEINAQNDYTPLLFSIDGGDFVEENSFVGAPQSEYQITVQNAVGCTETFTANIDILPPFIADITSSDLSCHDSQDGQIEITGAAGVAPYEYSIQNTDFQEFNTFENLPTGIYSVQISDAGGYTSEPTDIEITAPTALELGAVSEDGNLIVIIEGGTGAYSFSLNGIDFQTDSIFYSTPNDFYTIIARDENGCEQSLDYAHTTNSLNVNASAEVINSCANDSYFSAEICITGGLAPYELNTFPAADIISEIENESCETLYLLEFLDLDTNVIEIVTLDQVNNQFHNFINVEYTDTLTVNHTINDNNLTVYAESGAAPFAYSIDGINFQEDGYFSDLENGIYTVTATDANGCITEFEVLIDVTSTTTTANDAPLLFQVFPNPAQDYIVISHNNIEAVNIEIFDAAGGLISRFKNIRTEEYTVDVQKLAKGVYHIRLQGENSASVKKFVVMR